MSDEHYEDMETREEWAHKDIERMRRKAYADPDAGSDMLFVKAMRLDAMGDSGGAAAVRAQAIERAQEIRASYPYRGETDVA